MKTMHNARRVRVAMLAVLVTSAVAALPTSAVPSAAAPTTAGVDASSVLVQLAGEPLSVSARTGSSAGDRVDLTSAAARTQRAVLEQVRAEFRRWLETAAPAARITSEFDIALQGVGVELNGTPLSIVRGAPLVRRVEAQQVFTPVAHGDPDLSLVHANEAWTQVGGAANAGAGVRVAVIDSGIDVRHKCFDDAGYPAQEQRGDTSLTNNKVVVARVFSNRQRQDGLDASAVDGHGTHVAGTIACNAHTPAVISGVDIPYDPSGVAPRALLGSYNVFPGETGFARSEDIVNALEAAYADGMQIANMSLGGARNDGGGAFLLDKAVDNLDEANMVVVVAAGNEGPGYFTVHYPGAAPRALTAGASVVGHNIVNIVTVAGTDYESVVGDFGTVEADLSAPLAVVTDAAVSLPHGLSLACDAPLPTLPPGIDLTGKIALLGRGECDFTVKMRNAQNAGAVGVITVNHTAGQPPFVMAHNGLEARPTIPGYMVSLEDGAVIDGHDTTNVTLRALGEYVTTPSDTNLMASFSSWGPTHGDLLVKPDVVAPGADIISAFPAEHCDPLPPEGCWSFLGGTSMATPHVAGAAAVVRGAHPDWRAAHVRSAIVSTAQQNLLRHPETGAVTNDVQIVGAGLLDVADALGATIALDPVSQSFGAIAAGSGGRRTGSIAVTNISTAPRAYVAAVADDAGDGVLFATTKNTFTLQPGQSTTIPVTATATKKASQGQRQAMLRLSIGGVEVAHAALWTLIGSGDRAPGQHMAPPPFA